MRCTGLPLPLHPFRTRAGAGAGVRGGERRGPPLATHGRLLRAGEPAVRFQSILLDPTRFIVSAARMTCGSAGQGSSSPPPPKPPPKLTRTSLCALPEGALRSCVCVCVCVCRAANLEDFSGERTGSGEGSSFISLLVLMVAPRRLRFSAAQLVPLNPDSGGTQSMLARAGYFYGWGRQGFGRGWRVAGAVPASGKRGTAAAARGNVRRGERESPGQVKENPSRCSCSAFYYYYYCCCDLIDILSVFSGKR